MKAFNFKNSLLICDYVFEIVLKNAFVLSLKALIGSTTIQVPTLDNRKKQIQMNEIINPNTEKRIAGEGLPYPKLTNKKGDIIVKFDIKFPDTLSQQQRDTICGNLPR